MTLSKNVSQVLKSSQPLSGWKKAMSQFSETFNHNHGFSPKVEIKEKKHGYVVRAEIPGMDESEIKVYLHEGNLILEGEKQSETSVDDVDYHSSEFSYGSFYRSIPMNEEIDDDSIKTTYKNGVLRVEMKKLSSGHSRSRAIEVTKN